MTQYKVESTVERQAFQLLAARYKFDPGWFATNWPELGELVARVMTLPHKTASPFGLTENERSFHIGALKGVLARGHLDPAIAVTGLEHCASLLRDDWAIKGIDLTERTRLVRACAGKSHTSFKRNTAIPIVDADESQAAHHVSLLRGVVLDMDVNMRLLSITVTPGKVRETKNLMSIAEIGSDSETDVARRHDEYLAEVSPHGVS